MNPRTFGTVIALIFFIGAVLTAFVFDFHWSVPCILLVIGVIVAGNTPLEEPKVYVNETPVDARRRENEAMFDANQRKQAQKRKAFRPQRDHLETDCEDLVEGADIIEEILENIVEARETIETDRAHSIAAMSKLADASSCDSSPRSTGVDLASSRDYTPAPCASDYSPSSSSSNYSSSSSSDYSSSSSSSSDSGGCSSDSGGD